MFSSPARQQELEKEIAALDLRLSELEPYQFPERSRLSEKKKQLKTQLEACKGKQKYKSRRPRPQRYKPKRLIKRRSSQAMYKNCFLCGKPSHWASKFPKKKSKPRLAAFCEILILDGGITPKNMKNLLVNISIFQMTLILTLQVNQMFQFSLSLNFLPILHPPIPNRKQI